MHVFLVYINVLLFAKNVTLRYTLVKQIILFTLQAISFRYRYSNRVYKGPMALKSQGLELDALIGTLLCATDRLQNDY